MTTQVMECKFFYLTMGENDMVAIHEAPDHAVAAVFSVQLGMLGNVRTRFPKLPIGKSWTRSARRLGA
jgi:uncharacterized protein with GYD domain